MKMNNKLEKIYRLTVKNYIEFSAESDQEAMTKAAFLDTKIIEIIENKEGTEIVYSKLQFDEISKKKRFHHGLPILSKTKRSVGIDPDIMMEVEKSQGWTVHDSSSKEN